MCDAARLTDVASVNKGHNVSYSCTSNAFQIAPHALQYAPDLSGAFNKAPNVFNNALDDFNKAPDKLDAYNALDNASYALDAIKILHSKR